MGMELNAKSRVKDYSTHFIHNTCIYKVRRCRFEALLTSLHFSNNESYPEGNRLKLEAILNMCNKNFRLALTPGQYTLFGESMIPFRRRLSFFQYIPDKRHKRGIQNFELWEQIGCTDAN